MYFVFLRPGFLKVYEGCFCKEKKKILKLVLRFWKRGCNLNNRIWIILKS